MTLHNYGDGDFYDSGKPALDEMVMRLGLSADAAVLDIGCGSGRMAWPIADFLSENGAYIGFDVSKNALGFAEKLIKRRRDDFRFHHADIYSREYNPNGVLRGADYVFPCADAWSDFVFAISVFTHLLEKDAAHFLKEIARTLKPRGVANITAYLVDDAARDRMERGEAQLIMQRYDGPVWAGDLATPEAATGYDEKAFLDLISAAGLQLAHPIVRGGWSKPASETYTQDVLALQKA